MARRYARVKVNIWADLDFRALTPIAQHLYFVLLTSPSLNLAGVADWRPSRLSALAKGLTPGKIRAAGEELEQARFVVIDEDTEEVLVRTFVRHDGILNGPKTAIGMARDHSSIASARIMRAVAIEVQRAAQDDPTLGGLPQVAHLLTEATPNPTDTPSDTQPDTPSPEYAGSIPILHPSSLIPHPAHLTPRGHAASLLGWDERDERLDKLDDLLAANKVRHPRPWLDRCHTRGDLEDLITSQAHNTNPNDGWDRGMPTPPCTTCGAPPEVGHYDECPHADGGDPAA